MRAPLFYISIGYAIAAALVWLITGNGLPAGLIFLS